jgi:hypothetical protein
MPTRFRHVLLATLWLLAPAYGGSQELVLRTEGKNLFRPLERDLLVQTLPCQPRGKEDGPAHLIYREGSTSHVMWKDGTGCEVKAVLGPIDVPKDRFNVTVTRQAHDWYELFGLNAFVRAPMCLRISVAEEGVLNILAKDDMRLIFRDGVICTVSGVYGRLKP